MPFPDWLARLNRRVINPVLGLLADRLPPLAVVVHRGRTSDREYRTPVLAFRDGDGFVIALTYGPDRDWVKNVRAAGGCTLIRAGRKFLLHRLEIVDEGEGLPPMPGWIRPVVRRLGVKAFLRLQGGPVA